MTANIQNMSFNEFLLKCRTFDPAHEEPQLIPDWPYVTSLADALMENDRLIVVKSRQMMASWVGCAFILYCALTSGPGVHLLLSKEERSAKELITRIDFLYQNFEGELEDAKSYKGSFVFPELGSRIISLPASPFAVRGLSPRTLFWDETAFTPNDEEIWAAIKPAVDAGGKFFAVSTPNGPSGVFARLVHGGEKGFSVHRIHFSQRPDRGNNWEERARAGLSIARWRREQELSFEGAEGRVFDQFESEIHIIDQKFEDLDKENCRFYRGIDFGYRHPACVWLALDNNGSMTVIDTIVGDKWPIHQFVQEIYAIDRKHGLTEKDITWTAVDPAGKARTDLGISPVEHLEAANFKIVYSPSSIAAGVELIRALLCDAAGKVRLKLLRGCGPLIRAFQGYAWDAQGEAPVKDGIHDHPMDALRYLIVNLHRAKHQINSHLPLVAGAPANRI